MPARSTLESPADQQLLTQLGQRLREARRQRQLSAADLARSIGISRSTLQAVESGDASPTIGTYLKVLSSLGLGADFALLAAGEAPAAYRVQVAPRPIRVEDDLRLMALHKEAVRLLSLRSDLVDRVREILASMPDSDVTHTLAAMLDDRDWDDLLKDAPSAARLRAASPLPRIVPPDHVEEIVARFMRCRAHRERVRPQVEAALAELAASGVTAEVVGSFAWGDFQEHSDVDFLILGTAGRPEWSIVETIESAVTLTPVDVVFLEHISDSSREILMAQRLRHGRARLPTSHVVESGS